MMPQPFNKAAARKPADGELVAAADRKDIEAIKDLLERGAKVDEKNANGDTALLIAVAIGSAEMARILIDGGANVDIKDRNGCTALINTAYYGYKEWAQLTAQRLIDKDAFLGEKNDAGDTAFSIARFIVQMHGGRGIEFSQMLRSAAAARKVVEAEKARQAMVREKRKRLTAHAPRPVIGEGPCH